MTRGAIIPGGLYAGKRSDGTGYVIVKVLRVDFAVHIRIYAEDCKELPQGIKSSSLKVALGHAPMSPEAWGEKHILLGVEPVTEDELSGYRAYMGG